MCTNIDKNINCNIYYSNNKQKITGFMREHFAKNDRIMQIVKSLENFRKLLNFFQLQQGF